MKNIVGLNEVKAFSKACWGWKVFILSATVQQCEDNSNFVLAETVLVHLLNKGRCLWFFRVDPPNSKSHRALRILVHHCCNTVTVLFKEAFCL